MSEILYQKLGIDAETASSLTEESVNEIINKYNEGLKSSFLESEDFFKSIDKNKLPSEIKNELLNEGQAKIAGMSKKALDKEFGLTEEDKRQFSEEDLKNIDKYIARVKEIHLSKVSNGNKDVSVLQSENLELKQKLSEYQTQINSLEEKFNSDLNEKLTNKEIEVMTMMEVGKMTDNILGNPLATFKLIYPTLQSKYNIHSNNGVLEIRSKENPQFKVETEINGKKQFLTLEKAIELEYRHIGLWKEQQQTNETQKKVTVVSNAGEQRQIPAHVLEKIQSEQEA